MLVRMVFFSKQVPVRITNFAKFPSRMDIVFVMSILNKPMAMFGRFRIALDLSSTPGVALDSFLQRVLPGFHLSRRCSAFCASK